MQHIDEGTIHSWLDGALSADEAARVEAHVAECAQCAAAVAEARGFIAAASRILTALDQVPRGVVPIAPPIKWYNRAAWRAAAAVLVVAFGSLVVLRGGSNNSRQSNGLVVEEPDTAPIPHPAPPIVIAASPAKAPARKPNAATSVTPSTRSAISSRVASSAKPAAEVDFSGKSARGATPTEGAARERARSQSVDAVAAPQAAGAVIAAPEANAPSRVAALTTMDAASEQPLLKKVGKPRMLGAKVTLYEIAPGDTVTLTEIQRLQLNGIVSGVATAQPMMGRAAGKSAAATTQRADAEAVSAPDSQIRVQTAEAGAARRAAPVPPLQVEVVNGLTTISWPDATTGNMLRLSGRMSVERLKEIKIRIERERAAAAKKRP